MKEFAIYTALRLLLFLATWGVVLGAWVLLAGEASVVLTLLIAFVISGIGSYYVLNTPRERFAQKVEGRAARASAKFEEMRTKEDAED